MSRQIDEKELEEILKESGVKTMPSLTQKWLEQGIQQGGKGTGKISCHFYLEICHIGV